MNTISYWKDTQSLPRYSSLDRDLEVDAVVVGAGITGVTAAYLLKQAGVEVILLDRDRCGGVDTSYTSGHLTQVPDIRLNTLVDRFGADHAKAVWEAGGAALDKIFAIHVEQDLDSRFRWVPAYLFNSIETGAGDLDGLNDDAVSAELIGISASYRAVAPPFGGPAVQFPQQGLFHPLKYLRGLLRQIPGKGCEVYEHSEVTNFDHSSTSLTAGGHRISCRFVVLATQTPAVGSGGSALELILQSKLARYTTYVTSARLPSTNVPDGLYWDTAEPYNYLRVERRRGHTHLILGGDDHKTGQEAIPSEVYERLHSRLQRWFPGAKVDHQWSGQVVETNDRLPFIGMLDDRVFVATGFAGNGLTFGTLAGMMAADALLGVTNPWTRLFDPHRNTVLKGGWNYLKENKDYPYYFVRNWIAEGDETDLSVLKRGQGRVITLGGKKVAAYRDSHGKLTCCSPVCTHLKCIVNWNDAEQTWDCPCHGSRFQATGEVMAGPAQTNLVWLDPEDLVATHKRTHDEPALTGISGLR